MLEIDRQMLERFENGLDPRHPEKSAMPARVIGYGEISTVLEIEAGGQPYAYKRVPMFRSLEEADLYVSLYHGYLDALCNQVGIQAVPSGITTVVEEKHGRVVAYIVQEKLPAQSIANKAIHILPAADVKKLVIAVLAELSKGFNFNRQNKGQLELGIDGQMSNWAIDHFGAESRQLPEDISLVYLDTSSPLMRRGGKEQLDPELFLRSAPSFMVWILRLLFVQDVMTRYYDFRKVSIDLLANFYKEQRAELIPDLIMAANDFFAAQIQIGEFRPLTMDEVKSYYQEDAWIWRFYLAFRKIDRFLHRLLRRYYPYILPEKIKR